jgi:hypothetical protein
VSDLVTTLVCIGFSFWRPSLLSSSAIVPILRLLLRPYMETATPSVNALQYTNQWSTRVS